MSIVFSDQENPIPIAWTRLTIPQQGPDHLKRPRLIEALHNAIGRKLVLVRAPAGYGKTSLLVNLARETDLQVCWYTLESQSNDLSSFIIHLIASISKRFPSFGSHTLEILHSLGGQVYTQLRSLVATMVDEILNTIPEYFFLVLDDYQALSQDSAVHEFIRLYIDFMPEQCHLIVASRTVPPLPLVRLYARQQMAAIGVDELRFTDQEIRELAESKLRATLPLNQAHLLGQQTDGWITAILLAADRGWDALSTEDAGSIDMSETGIYDYLMSEVLDDQPPEIQQFLLHTCVLDEMTVPLCTAVAGYECRTILRSLERHNLFITVVERSGLETTYRYHPLFREFLVERLWRRDEQLYRDLHASAGQYAASQQDWIGAIDHYVQAERFSDVKGLILSHYAELDSAGHRESLARWIDQFQPEYMTPELQLRRAELANELGETDTALRLYTNAIILYESSGIPTEIAYALIERSFALAQSGSYDQAIDDCESALTLLTNEPDTDSLRGRAYRYLGIYYAETGDPGAAQHYLSFAHQAWTRCNESPRNMALLAQSQGMVYEVIGDFDRVHQECQRALTIWESLGNQIGIADALNGIGVACHRREDYATALDMLREAMAKSQATGSIRAQAYALTSLGDLYRDLGQFEQALSFFAEASEKNLILGEPYLRSYLVNARAETLYLAGQIERAQSEIEEALADESLFKSHEAWQRIVFAATLLDQRKTQRARQELESVLLEPSLQNEIAFRGYMQLAQAAMIDNAPQESEKHLRTAIQLAQEVGLTQPLSVESLNHIGVLTFVSTERGQDEEIAKWIDAAHRLDQVRQELIDRKKTQAAPTLYPDLQIEALGNSRILVQGKPASWRTAQAKELFFYLLTHPEGQTKEQIGAVLWPTHSFARLSSIFRSSLFRLRKALFAEVILFDGEVYRLNPQISYTYDVHTFEQACTSAEFSDNPTQKAYYYRQAIGIYHGSFLPDLYGDWITRFRETLQARHLQALGFLATFSLESRNYPQAITFARQILSVDEHHETAYHALIRAYVRSGQRPRAKQIFDTYQSMLRQFGLEPQRDWQDLSTQQDK